MLKPTASFTLHTRKIFRLLQQLPETERQAFDLYLQSPFLNSSSLLRHFYTILLPELDKPAAQVPSDRDIHGRLPTDSQFSKNYFDKLCAALVKAVHDFLTLQEFRQNDLLAPSTLLASLNRLRLDEFIPSMYKALSRELKALPTHDALWLHAQFRLERVYGDYLFRQPRKAGGEQLLQINQRLDESYFAGKLELASALHNYNTLFKEGLPEPDLSSLRETIESAPDRWPTLIRIRYHAFLMLAEQDENSFHKLMALMDAEGAKLADEVRSETYILALNYCAFQINQGNADYLSQADCLHLHLLEGGWLLQKGKLPSELFKNIISLRLRMGAIEWVARFIEEYADRLSNPHNGMAVKYCQALLKFHTCAYDDCIRILQEVLRDVKSDMYYGTDARVFLLKAYYLRDLPDDSYLLESNLNAFRVYVTRHKNLGEQSRKRHQNLVRLFRGLIRLREMPGEGRVDTLQKFLQDIQSLPLSQRNWFEQQGKVLLDSVG